MPQAYFHFDEFELDSESCELRRSGHYVKLERIPMQLLILLLENPGKLVRREAIVERLWGSSVFVEAEHSINTAVNKLRSILRDDPRNPHFIRTVVGQGYCFIAKVKVNELSAVASSYRSARSNQTFGHLSPDTQSSNSATAIDEPEVMSNTAPTEEEEQPQETAKIIVEKRWHHKRWLIAFLGVVVAALIVLGVIYRTGQQKDISETPLKVGVLHSVAVLPFRNLAQSPDQDYLVDGMTDQLTTDLARNTSLRVISQRSAMQYKGVQKPIQEIARALNVDAIVEGSYLRSGKQVRITAQLIDARNDQHIWAQTYDESNKDLLSMQDQVTSDIAHQVAIALGSRFTQSKSLSVNPNAREDYIRGRYFWNERTLPAVNNSIKYYTYAIREDPHYADAYAALAKAYVLRAVYGGHDPSDALWKAQYAAERALELNPSLGEAHVALGAVKVERDWDWAGAEKEYRRALQLNPEDSTAHHRYSLHLTRMGKVDEAEAEIQRALTLDPLSLIINTDAAQIAYMAGDLPKAMAGVERVLALNSNFAEAHLTKGKILERMNKYQEAETEYETAKRLFSGASFLDAFRAHAMALSGKREEALKLTKQLESAPPANRVSGSAIAIAYCALAQPVEAMKWLNLAYEHHENGMGLIGVDPIYDRCRDDAQFKELLSKLKLAS